MAMWSQRLIREKLETVPGTAIATAAADALYARNVTIRNLDADYAARDYVIGIAGAQGEDLSNVHMAAEYDIEAAPPVSAASPPLYAHLLQSSGMLMASDDGDTVFTPLDPGAAIPSCTLHLKNGALQQVSAGMRGSLSFTAEAGQKPFFRFNRRGKYQAPVAYVQEAHDFSGWPQALECIPENMFAVTLGGTTLLCRSFNFTDGRQPQTNKYMNAEGTNLGPRNFTGRLTVQWPALAAKDLLTQIRGGVSTVQALVWTLGRTAGQTIQISAPRVQIKWAGEQDIEGDLGINLDLVFLPTGAGNDEIEIRYQ